MFRLSSLPERLSPRKLQIEHPGNSPSPQRRQGTTLKPPSLLYQEPPGNNSDFDLSDMTSTQPTTIICSIFGNKLFLRHKLFFSDVNVPPKSVQIQRQRHSTSSSSSRNSSSEEENEEVNALHIGPIEVANLITKKVKNVTQETGN